MQYDFFSITPNEGFHTKIIQDLGGKYKCYNYSTKEEITISKELLQFVKPEIIKECEQNKDNKIEKEKNI